MRHLGFAFLTLICLDSVIKNYFPTFISSWSHSIERLCISYLLLWPHPENAGSNILLQILLFSTKDSHNVHCLASLPEMKRLLTGTVPVNNSVLTGTVPINNSLLEGTVTVNNLLLTRTIDFT